MTATLQTAMQAVIQATETPGEGGPLGIARPVVAVSRDHGSGGDEIARKLAERLGVPCYDQELVTHVAARLETDATVARMIDESVGKARDMWLTGLVTGRDLGLGTTKRHLVNVILSLAKAGGVLVGRGSHVVLSSGAALRVRITGSPEVCARRLAKAEGLTPDAALKQVKDINHNRGKFVWDLFHVRTSEASAFDLVLNTDRLNDWESLVDTLVAATQAIQTAQGGQGGH
ncbi:AAA family ATPase [Roseospirillum parvum]|uniref:Cytidylate kinase n=1 Tax=Roseospirillum parvum TaxID=83401 RepID=A0A1G7ZXS7_9PROT|nr:cytidylate kinase-like family protein [Roseospirillum parvum]SDH13416.1 Cytidylate kinase [Roseospirillum parvum]